MFAGCLQIMWAHSHLIRAEGIGYLQLIRAENADVCRSYGLCLQAATVNQSNASLDLYSFLLQEYSLLFKSSEGILNSNSPWTLFKESQATLMLLYKSGVMDRISIGYAIQFYTMLM